MRDNDLFAELSRRLSALMPAAETMRDEMRTKIEQTLKNGLQDLDVLSREEFEAQARALVRAQEHVLALEARIQALETRLDALSSAGLSSPGLSSPGESADEA